MSLHQAAVVLAIAYILHMQYSSFQPFIGVFRLLAEPHAVTQRICSIANGQKRHCPTRPNLVMHEKTPTAIGVCM